MRVEPVDGRFVVERTETFERGANFAAYGSSGRMGVSMGHRPGQETTRALLEKIAAGEAAVKLRRQVIAWNPGATEDCEIAGAQRVLARAVREGLLARNPAEGEDLRLEVRREKKYGLELDEAMSLVDAAGSLDQRPGPNDELRRRIARMRAAGKAWKAIAAEVGIAESTAIYHSKRLADRSMPRYRPVIATLTLAGLRVTELCDLNCEHVDLARREIRVLDAKTPAGVRRVDIHDDLQDELAAYKAARGATWQSGAAAFLNARGKRWTRNAIAQHIIPPSLEEANRQRGKAGLPAIRNDVTPHTLRYTCIASLFAAGADQEYVAAQVGHEDVTTTNRIYRYVLQRRRRGEIGRRRQLAMRESAADVGQREHPATRALGR